MIILNRTKSRYRLTVVLWTVAFGLAGGAAWAGQSGPSRWETQIRQFEAQDREQPPPTGGIVFMGSSSIRGWDLTEYFADLPVVNRGFGGSQLEDAVYFAHRIILPYRPRVVVVYAGDNDIASGKSPQRVADDYQALVQRIHGALPSTRIIFLAIKPSIARWSLVTKMREANRLIRAKTQADARLVFVDIDRPMIGPDDRPRKELFVEDGLHLNAAGYRLWSDLLRPHLGLPRE